MCHRCETFCIVILIVSMEIKHLLKKENIPVTSNAEIMLQNRAQSQMQSYLRLMLLKVKSSTSTPRNDNYKLLLNRLHTINREEQIKYDDKNHGNSWKYNFILEERPLKSQKKAHEVLTGNDTNTDTYVQP